MRLALRSGARLGERCLGRFLDEAVENSRGADSDHDGRKACYDESSHGSFSSFSVAAYHAGSVKASISISMKIRPTAPTRM
jgi:hypothetical protein